MIAESKIKALLGQALDPHCRYDFEFTYSVEDGNPNGDPDNGAHPRQTPDGRLEVTDAKLKRMIRDYLEEVYKRNIYISRRVKEEGLANDTGDGPVGLKSQSVQFPKPEDAIAHFMDIMLFGATYLPPKDGDPKGKSGQGHQILGPVQIGMGRSREPVEVRQTQISRILSEDSNQGTFGDKFHVEKAEIVFEGRYSGNIGRKMGVSSQNLLEFWTAMINGVELRRSTMSGKCTPVSLTVTCFSDPYGLTEPTKVEVTF